MIGLSDVLVFLLISLVVSILSKKFNFSTVLGFLVSGILVGPYLGNFLSSSKTIDFFSDIGVIFLLFTIGLHLPIEKIKNIKFYIFGFGAIQVFATTIAYTVACKFLFEMSINVAFLLGIVVSLSSTALVIKILEEDGELGTDYGKASFGTLLFQDLASIATITLIPILGSTGEQASLIIAMVSLLKSVVLLSVIVFLAKYVVKPIYKWASENGSQTFMSITLMSIFGIASLTAYVGISTELGAFLAGVLMAGSEYRLQVEADIEPFKELLMGLFFITVGTSMNFNMLTSNKLLVFEVVASILLIKAIVIFLTSIGIRYSIASGIRAAFLMCGGGEFSFVIFAALGTSGLISSDKIQLFSLSISLAMALTPIINLIGKFLAEKIEMKKLHQIDPESISIDKDLTGHVIIAGFGRVGQIIANLLAQHLVPFIAIDSNMDVIVQARAKGLQVYYGDAKRREVYRLLGAHKAKMIAVTLGKSSTSEKAASMLIQNFPNLNIWLRISDTQNATSLEKAGLNVVVPEFLEPGLQIAKAVLKASGINNEDAEQSINKYRDKYKIKNVSTQMEEIDVT